MNTCAGITRGAAFDCDNKPQAGVNETFQLANLDDIESFVEDGDQVITDIIMKPGKLIYNFEGTRNSLVPSSEFGTDGAASGYEHMAQFLVFDKTQVSRNNIEKLADKQVVAFIKNLEGTYEVLGKSVGLLTSEMTRAYADRATAGSFQVTIKTSEDGAFEAKLPQVLDAGDEATTDALIESLLNLPSITNVSPLAVAAAGGDAMVITGLNFLKNAIDDVQSVDFIDGVDVATNQAAFNTDSNTQITIAATVALPADTYRVRVTTTSGVAETELIVVSS